MKDFFLTDQEIKDLIDEPKRINCSATSLSRRIKIKRGKGVAHFQYSLKFPRNNEEGKWRIFLRRSKENPLDFSCGLGFIPKGRNHAFILIRYNGKSHQHKNQLENENTFYDFHIHQATEKYQKSSHKNEHYARPTESLCGLPWSYHPSFD